MMRSPADTESARGRRSWRLTRVGLAMGLIAALVLGGSSVAFAIWTAQATVTSNPSSADLTISTSGFSSLNYTYGNDKLSTTGSFTLTNTTSTASGQAGNFTATLGYASGGEAALATGLTVRVWPTANIANCTPAAAVGSGSVSGNWASGVAVSGTLTAGQVASYCVRSTADERGNIATADGSLAITASISATLTIGGWSETATATSAQATQYIYPYFSPLASTWYEVRNVATGNCVDVYQDLTVTGTPLIDYACKANPNYNQEWMFAPTTGNYFDVISRSANALRWDTVGGSTVAGVPVDVQTDNNVRVSQEWQLQNQGSNVYQFVNKLSGMCLQPLDTAATTSVEYAQVVCSGAANQRFTLVFKFTEPPPPVVPVITGPLGCTDYGTEGGRRFTLSWTPNATEAYTVQVRQGTTGNWTIVKNIATGANNVNVDPAAGVVPLTWPDGTYDLRVVAGTAVTPATTALATRTFWKGTGSAGNYLRCAQPVAAISSIACADTGTSGTTRRVAYTWSPESTETFSVQSRVVGGTGAWSQIGSVAAGVSTYTLATGAPLLSTADGTYNIRVIAGTSTAAATTALATSTVWKGTGSAGAYLRCAEPTPTIAAMNCVNTGSGNTNANNNSRVQFTWSEEATRTYVLQIQNAGGTWSDYATIAAGATSAALAPGSQTTAPFGWATNTYNTRIVVQGAGTVLATDTFYKAGGTGSSQYLRCDPPQIALSCSGTNTLTVGWSGLPTGTYRLQVNNGTWTTVTTSSATSGAGNIALADLTQGDGTYAVRLINAADTQMGTRSVLVEGLFFWGFRYGTQLVCE